MWKTGTLCQKKNFHMCSFETSKGIKIKILPSFTHPQSIITFVEHKLRSLQRE